MSSIATFVSMVQAIALAALMASSLGMISRWTGKSAIQEAVMGALFGVATIISMSAPITLGDGIIIDLRNLFIGVAAGFFGWIGGSITLGIAVGTRLGIGGDGAVVGIFAMVMAAGCGALWRVMLAPRLRQPALSGLALGGLISLTILASLLLPAPLGRQVFVSLGPLLLVLYLFGSMLLTSLLTREYRLLSEAAALNQAALTDPLTNLPNRRRTQEFVASLAQRGPTKPGVAMLYFDIDRFKTINDTYGHCIGDAVLRGVTERVNACLRSTDHLARHGGDEFVVIQTGLTEEEALSTAERCRKAVSGTPIVSNDQSVEVTISIGLHWSQEQMPFNTLFRSADEALYRAKSEGRNRIGQLAA